MKIYFCIVAVFSALLSVSCEIPAEIRQQRRECAEETGVNIEEFVRQPHFDDTEGKCFHACMMKRDGTMIGGKASAERAIELFEQDNQRGLSDPVKATFIECAEKANEEIDECEVVGVLHACILEKDVHK